MKKAIIKSDIILFLLIVIFVGVIITFVDFPSNNKKKDYNINVYKSYYVYDELSNPISLSYNMLNINKNIDKEKIIKKVFTSISNNISDNLKILNIEIKEKEITLELSEDITNSNELNIECLVNSLIEIDNYNKINFKYEDTILSYNSTINKYYINSPIINKLYSFLYRDKNYKIVYIDEQNQESYLTIKTSKDNYVIYNVNDNEERWSVKKDGLYINDDKILTNTYKVNDMDDNLKVLEVKLEHDNTLLIKIEQDNDDRIITYVLKQGLGIYSYEEKSLDGTIIKTYTYKEKVFNEG